MGFGAGGAATFVELKDTPGTYTGQSGKLAKVKATEDGLDLTLLLSFTNWYAGGAPASHPWEFEADNPLAWDFAHFTPIIKNGIGQFIAYATGWNINGFYRYNLTTKQWHKLSTPPVIQTPYIAPSMSPDKAKIASVVSNGKYLYLYDIEANSWTTSSAAPQIDALDAQLCAHVWADDDTIWCQCKNTSDKVMVFKYVVSTDTWTDFANSISPTRTNCKNASINSAGTIVYFGGVGAAVENILKYTIATDAYDVTQTIGGGQVHGYCSDRDARLWVHNATGGTWKYWNCDTDTLVYDLFEANPLETIPSSWCFGVIYNEDKGIIAAARTAEPKNMSYFGSGMWKLGQQVLTDYNLVVFKKPADGHAIVAVDKANGYTVPIHLFSNLVLPAGTWEFFYPKDGDYTQLVISGSELK